MRSSLSEISMGPLEPAKARPKNHADISKSLYHETRRCDTQKLSVAEQVSVPAVLFLFLCYPTGFFAIKGMEPGSASLGSAHRYPGTVMSTGQLKKLAILPLARGVIRDGANCSYYGNCKLHNAPHSSFHILRFYDTFRSMMVIYNGIIGLP